MERDKPRSSVVVKTLTDKELRKHAMQLAADAIVLARLRERAYARAAKKGSGEAQGDLRGRRRGRSGRPDESHEVAAPPRLTGLALTATG
jgi:hypothetical protein